MGVDDGEGVMARMRAESPRAVVEVTLADESLLKVATGWLEARGRPADADAAARLVLAHARREASPWVIAQLLVCVPHPIGLTTAVALLAEQAFGADTSAAKAIAAMGDRSVAPTLEALLLTRADVDATRGAARALGGLPRQQTCSSNSRRVHAPPRRCTAAEGSPRRACGADGQGRWTTYPPCGASSRRRPTGGARARRSWAWRSARS
jgi:hypothetical protein